MKYFLLFVGAAFLIMLIILCLVTIWYIVEEFELVDKYFDWIEGTLDHIKENRRKRGG